jgi:hypothetical protein
LGLALTSLAELAKGFAPGKTGDRRRLASARIPSLLGVEKQAREAREARSVSGHSPLIRTMSLANPLWGAPHIHGELLKLGIEVSQATVAKCMVRTRKPPSQTWRTFLKNHASQLASTDFFVVPTVTFRLLYVFIVLVHQRRRVIHFNVTAHPSWDWTAHQIAEAFP